MPYLLTEMRLTVYLCHATGTKCLYKVCHHTDVWHLTKWWCKHLILLIWLLDFLAFLLSLTNSQWLEMDGQDWLHSANSGQMSLCPTNWTIEMIVRLFNYVKYTQNVQSIYQTKFQLKKKTKDQTRGLHLKLYMKSRWKRIQWHLNLRLEDNIEGMDGKHGYGWALNIDYDPEGILHLTADSQCKHTNT